MFQILGWLGCVYLVVKALEIGSSTVFRDEGGLMKLSAVAACAIAWMAAIIFAFLFYGQGAAMRSPMTGVFSQTSSDESVELPAQEAMPDDNLDRVDSSTLPRDAAIDERVAKEAPGVRYESIGNAVDSAPGLNSTEDEIEQLVKTFERK